MDVKKALKRFLLGDRQSIAGTVYGTIIVLSILAAGGKAYKHHLWQLDALAAVSAVVLWLAHVYSHGLGESLSIGRRLTVAELSSVARREYSIVLAAVPPLVAIALGAIGVLPQGTSVWLAFGTGVVTLTGQGVRYARLERLSTTAAIITVSLNLAAGVSLVAMEALIAH
jgi:hypothetical protein